MNWLQSILENTNTPVLYAFILGLMTAISPCPLATNITAIGFISKDISNRNHVFLKGIIYTLGRAISYTLLGLILFFGAGKFHVARLFQHNGEKFLGPFLIIIGLLMLDVIKMKFSILSGITNKIADKQKGNSVWGVLILGMIFALAFCPYSGVLFFGMLIPISIVSVKGLYLPVVFAFATGLPVIIVAYLLAFSLSGIGNFYNRTKIFELWFRRFVSVLFILTGFYYVYIFYF